MAGCGKGPEDNVCLRWTWVKVIILVCCYGSEVRGGQSPTNVVTGGNLTARARDNVTFRCEVRDRNSSHIITVEWTRCDRGAVPNKVLVFMTSGSNLSLSDTHQGRVTMTTASSFTLRNVSMEDFGLYCCKLNMFPDGVLQAEVHLSEGTGEEDQNITLSGLPPQIVYILGGVCALVLVVVVTTVIVCKTFSGCTQSSEFHKVSAQASTWPPGGALEPSFKRRVQLRDYVNVSVHQGSVPKGQDDTGEENDKSTEENIKGAEEKHQLYATPCKIRALEGLSRLSGPEEAEMMTQHAT
ncbi:uncharacterized protein LOC121708696 isoform X2 [Alosa sapidissima]|uniref:uncharacterized protein LOC121708696 isoform X2 n=1 Tax=Alosa sapidissima TaxID=34773 RepID=UPI001C090012|nr:uncharacterized protein LOC121708696 isoform X2 [Alosa sapidissima]